MQDDGLIDLRAAAKMDEIIQELKDKTSTDIYIHLSNDNGLDSSEDIAQMIKKTKQKEQDILSNIEGSYVVLFLSIKQKYINIISSKDLEDIIDKDDIIDGYMVPLLASFDKNDLKSKVSAAVLNGVAQIGDVVALSHNIELQSSIGSVGKTTGTIWKMFMYSVVLFGIIAYFYIILRERKRRQSE